MARLKRNYIDSHWLVFGVQGALALVFGWILLFNISTDNTALVATVGVFLLGLGIVELFNALHREHLQHSWGVSLGVAVIDIVVALALILTIGQNAVWHLILIALYTFLRGIFELLIGFKTTDDPTDRFIWVICGICGAVMGTVIFNAGHLSDVDYVRFFGAYMLVLGVGSLIYSVHNRAQKIEAREARSEAARKAAETRAKNRAAQVGTGAKKKSEKSATKKKSKK